jgi:hypothetical protein
MELSFDGRAAVGFRFDLCDNIGNISHQAPVSAGDKEYCFPDRRVV